MRRLTGTITVLLAAVCFQAVAVPLDPATQAELLSIYDRYSKLMAAGKLSEAAQFRTGKERAEMLAVGKKSKREQAEMLEMARLMTPDSVVPVHATRAKDGGVTIETVASKTWPSGLKFPNAPKPGTVTHGEVTLRFAREGQTWKLRDQIFGPDPAAIAACHDEAIETEAAYNRGVNGDIGGLIRRVEFRPDHTLVVLRVVDEENCLILPPRDRLGDQAGKLAPWAMIEAEGAPHRSDKQRFWADKWTVTEEEQ